MMKIQQKIAVTLLLNLLLTGCQFNKNVFPPPNLGTPQEISTFEVKGLTFADTATFSGMFAEEQVREYAEKHHYRYYVMTLRSSGFKGRAERVSAMMYH
ncbi:hypothetical protein [Serratia fonticola]|uniref:hypothetical protein n=1 Tax=Serratia fonticola TaxID=47917 RepID=UPI00211CB65A|nr:hypothetical protein [Serratia fonticola]CAI1242224.1 Uncharacterised protein [Serratia fonticola]